MHETSAAIPEFRAAGFGPGLAIAVARLSADATTHGAVAAAWLGGAEHVRCARFRVNHARADFLAGRIAAKSAARWLVPELGVPASWEIRSGENQQPRIDHVLPNHGVTLAHAGGVGLALVHEASRRYGIDLEPHGREADEAIATQVVPAEAAWARAGGNDARMRWLLLWTAREAQGKSHGTGLLEPERLAPTTDWQPAGRGWRARLADDAATMVGAVIAGGFVVSFVVPTRAEADALAEWLEDALKL